jgi:hypothetical protein
MAESTYKIERNKILVILGSNRELIGISSSKLYTSGKDNSSWLYSDLQGLLCFILDHSAKSRYFVLFDPVNYEKLFQFELYENFISTWQDLSEDFYCFEFSNGFIGFKFKSEAEASVMNLCVKKFNESFCEMLYQSYAQIKNNMINKRNESLKIYYEILKEKFCDGKNIYGKEYIEDGLEICKPKYFDLINNISYDKEKKEFVIGNIPEHLKKTFKNVGLKKKHFKNRQLALNIFKNVMQSMDVFNSQGDKLSLNLGKRLTMIKKEDDRTTMSTMQSDNSIRETLRDSQASNQAQVEIKNSTHNDEKTTVEKQSTEKNQNNTQSLSNTNKSGVRPPPKLPAPKKLPPKLPTKKEKVIYNNFSRTSLKSRRVN